MLRGVGALLWSMAAVTQVVAVHGPGLPAPGPEPHGCTAPAKAPPAGCEPLSGNLPFFYDLYTFRGQAGSTAIVAAYAVEAGRLRRERESDWVQYRLVVSLVLADTAARSVERSDDSVTVRMARSPPADHLLRTHLEVHAPPSLSTLQRVIISDVTRPGYGQLYDGPFPIPDYSGSQLMLSDLALGELDAEEGWKRGDVTLALLPTGRLPQGSFNLYYEIYNLPAGHAYSTEVSIERLGPDPEDLAAEPPADAVRTHFSGESTAGPDAVLPELRRVDSLLREGRYRLTVTIRDEVSGDTAERSRPFQIGP